MGVNCYVLYTNMYVFKLNNDLQIKIKKEYLLFKVNSNLTLTKFKNIFSLLIIKNDKLYLLNKKKLKLNYVYTLKNFLIGLNKQFTIKLNLVGLGFKINLIDSQNLILSLGYSHTISYKLPQGIEMYNPKNKGSIYLLKGSEYSKLKQVAANLINLKKPEPYKGKGIRYFNQIIKLKEGKKSNK